VLAPKAKVDPDPVAADPPKAGVPLVSGLLALKSPPEEAPDVPLAPPNWKGEDPPDAGPEEAPKLNRPGPAPEPVFGVAAPEPLALPAWAKGLLKELPPEAPPPPAEKLKPKPGVLLLPLSPLLVGGFDAAPKILVEDVPPDGLKLKLGADVGARAELVGPDLDGDSLSCFMGLPAKAEAETLLATGDLGTPNRGAEDPFALVVLLPGAFRKLKDDAALGCVVVGAVAVVVVASLDAPPPKRGFAGADELLPNKLLAEAAGFGAKREPAGALSLGAALDEPKRLVDLGVSDVSDLPASVGFEPKRVDDCMTDFDGSAGAVAEVKRVEAELVGAGPKRPEAGLGASASLVPSVEAVGLGAKRDDALEEGKGDCLASAVDLDALWESFSLSDSAPSLAASSVGFSASVVFLLESSGLAEPKILEAGPVVLVLGAKTEPAEAVEAPKMEVLAPVVGVGANLIGALLGFHVWSLAADSVSAGGGLARTT
jgi:hypothetical protein